MAKRQVETASSTGYNNSPEMSNINYICIEHHKGKYSYVAEKVQAASPADAATLILPDRRSQGCPLPGPPPGGPPGGPPLAPRGGPAGKADLGKSPLQIPK